MWPFISTRKRSWKTYLGSCCCLLVVTFITFQVLAWTVMGPQEEYDLNKEVLEAMKKVTSGINLHAHIDQPEEQREKGEHADGALRSLGSQSGPGTKRSSKLVKMFGSRSGLLSAIRRVKRRRPLAPGPGRARDVEDGAMPSAESKSMSARNGRRGGARIDKNIMKLAKARVAERKKRQQLGLITTTDRVERMQKPESFQRHRPDIIVPRPVQKKAAKLPHSVSDHRLPQAVAHQPAGKLADPKKIPVAHKNGHRAPRLRGVEPSQRLRYDLADGKQFHCLNGDGEGISASAINDEFCDCADGSDEPGTSACRNGRFFCPVERKHIFSSRVDDGRCDCCDGSDEPQSHACRETSSCDDLEKRTREVRARRERAAGLRDEYVSQGRQQAPAGGNFGQDSAFWPLSKRCYSKIQGEYKYEVCPFHLARQSKQGSDVSIGTGGEWQTLRSLPTIVMPADATGLLRASDRTQGYAVLRMSNGRPCPSGNPRTVQVVFECDVDEKLKVIGETEQCLYSALISTPAACLHVS
ncbi:uncharacterized protein LOC135826426 [Sycon ciliatum]|uniref:uncharacterized protein LOC135826426 n=1 Tax=Sycon ciliatum TaxID=27933 RepID=UPI0031F60F2F